MTQPHGEQITFAQRPFSVDENIIRIDSYDSEVFPVHLRTQAYDKLIYIGGILGREYGLDDVGSTAYMQRWASVESLQQRIQAGGVVVRSLVDEGVFRRSFGTATERLNMQREALLSLKETVESGVQEVGIVTEATDSRLVMSGSFRLLAYSDERPAVLTEFSRRGDAITGYKGEDVFNRAEQALRELWQDPTVLVDQDAVIQHVDWVIDGLDHSY